MSKSNNRADKSTNKVANVPNPPVPNRAHTEMKNDGNSSASKANNGCNSIGNCKNK